MKDFTNEDYIKMKNAGRKIFSDKSHETKINKIIKEKWNEIYGFSHQDSEKIKNWQLKRISEIVDYAYKHIPLYKKKYDAIGFKTGDIKTWEDYDKLPILTKEELINGFPYDIVKDIKDFALSTRSSGSSGKFVTLAVSVDAIYTDTIQGIRQYYFQSGNQYNPKDNVLFIYTCPWWLNEIEGLYKTYFLPTTSSIQDSINKIKEIRPSIISTYPTYLEKISTMNVNLSDYGVNTVIVHSEQSNRGVRLILGRKLNVNVLDEYSSEELTRIALECPYGTYHIEEDSCYVETVDPKTFKKIPDGEAGILIGTNLLNLATPIIKYNQGDLVIIDAPKKCQCGSKCRTINEIKGRYMDSIVADNNEIIPASAFMDLAYNWFLEFDIPVHGLRYQFVQYNKKELILYIIKDGFNIDIEKIKNSLYLLIPRTMDVKLKLVKSFPEFNGNKYKPIISFVRKDI